jgi:glucosamine--fructose-6-phosphate aminotransferase (isomerizing)
MLTEALEGPAAARRLLAQDADLYAALSADLVADDPQALLTVARGSSDHAAHYMAYLVMARLGRLVTSLPMSLVTLYSSQLRCQGLVSLAFSQSGQSPDLIAPTRYFRNGGARTVALVNHTDSPLARASEWVLPLHAGMESSVAATKSFIAQLVAGARLVVQWEGQLLQGATRPGTQDPDAQGLHGLQDLLQALPSLPEALQTAAACDWGAAVQVLQNADRLFVIGRGTGLAVAMEAALKLKEVCGIQAEAYSGAEIKHGPMALVEQGYPLLILAPRGPAQRGLLALAQDMRARGARVLLAAPAGTSDAELPLAPTAHEDLDPISVVQSFYPMVEALARARGLDPDSPRHLAKVTRTH